MSRLSSLSRHLTPSQLSPTPLRVTVTGAAGNIGYALVFMIAQGRMFGPHQPVILTLLEVPQAEKQLQGVVMELKDAACELVRGLVGTTDLKVGFQGCQYALLVGARPRGPGMERKDLLGANGAIFKTQGKAISDFADPNCKITVVGNPANTNALIASLNSTNVPKENFTALTRLDQNRAVAQIAEKLKERVENIKNVIIWGNHSLTQVPDLAHGFVLKNGEKKELAKEVNDQEWIKGKFINDVAKRGAAIIEARKLSSAASAASAVCDHVHDWHFGTLPSEYVSMGVVSDGSYGVPKGLVFSFPVECKQGTWKIVQGLNWEDWQKKLVENTTKELLEEKQMALEALK